MSHPLDAFRVSIPTKHHTEGGQCQCPAQVQWGWTRSGSSAKAHDTSGLGESPGGRRQTPARRCHHRRHSGRLCWRTPAPQRDSVSQPSATQACATQGERKGESKWEIALILQSAHPGSIAPTHRGCHHSQENSEHVCRRPEPGVCTRAVSLGHITSRFPRSHCMRAGCGVPSPELVSTALTWGRVDSDRSA